MKAPVFFELNVLILIVLVGGDLMGKIEIDRERCKACGLCTISCPKELIRIGKEMNRQGYFYAVWEGNGTCTGCSICGEICPDVAIQVWK